MKDNSLACMREKVGDVEDNILANMDEEGDMEDSSLAYMGGGGGFGGLQPGLHGRRRRWMWRITA